MTAGTAGRGGLFRIHDFRQLWLAQTISQFGTQVTVLALPLVAILVLEASAFEVAVLAAVEFLPFLLFTLPAGVWVDRLSRRGILLGADLGRAAILILVPVASLADALAMWQLYVIAFAAGTLTVFFDVAYQAILPELVERDRLAEGNSRLEVSRSAAQVAGPGFGGVLVGLVTAPLAIVADALSYLGSAAFLVRIRNRAPVRTDDQNGGPRLGLRREIAEGLRFYRSEPLLLAESAAIITINVASQIAFSIYLVFVVRELGLSPEALGLTVSIASIGTLVGAATAEQFGRWLGVGRALIVAMTMSCAGMFVIALTPRELAIPFLVLAGLVQGYAVMIINVNGVSIRQGVTPDELQGRVNATGRWLNWSAIPIASIVGGAIASLVGLRPTLLIGAILALTSIPWLVFSPIRTLRDIPTGPSRRRRPAADELVQPAGPPGQPPI